MLYHGQLSMSIYLLTEAVVLHRVFGGMEGGSGGGVLSGRVAYCYNLFLIQRLYVDS